MKAMILAAGRGERMRPLTDTTPKALLTIAGKPMITYHLEKLAACGITDIVINISHLADQIMHALGDGSKYGIQITYSYEETALETGGGIFQALPLLGNEPFILISSDVYTDYPFEKLLTIKPALGHLVLAPNPPFHPKGDFTLLPDGTLTTQPQYTFASFGVINPELFASCKAGRFSYVPLLKEAMDKKLVTGELYLGEWHNVGSVEQLKVLNQKLPLAFG